MTTNIFIIHEKYSFMYDKNVCCHYIREYIMTTNIFIIQESICRLIRGDI